MRLITLCLIGLVLTLQYRLWAGEHSIADYRNLQQDIEKQQATNEQLAQRNQLLQADIDDLRNAQEAVEELARNELGLVKENETFFRLIQIQKDN